MLIYLTMFIYIFAVGYFSKRYIKNNGIVTKYNNQTTLIFAILVLLLPVFFIGMRTDYNDTAGYITDFNSFYLRSIDFNDLFEERGYGWTIYKWIIHQFITKNANLFLMITAIIQAGAILKFYFKYSIDYTYSILLFFLSFSFGNMMGGIRQFMSVSLVLYFADYIFERRFLRFVVVAAVAILIHFSAIVWIPAFFVVQGKAWNKKSLAFSFLIVLAVMFVNQFTGLLEDSLIETTYAGYTSQFVNDDGSSVFHSIISFVPVAISFYGRTIISKTENKSINTMVNVSIFAFMISLLANFTSGILVGRLTIYFTVFNFALYPWLFKNVCKGKYKNRFRIYCIIGYTLYALYYIKSQNLQYTSSVLSLSL